MKKDFEIVGIFLGLVALTVFLAAISSFVLAFAWNTVIPHVFKLPSITAFQAFNLTILLAIFRGFASGMVKVTK
jgi:hypothetical protein